MKHLWLILFLLPLAHASSEPVFICFDFANDQSFCFSNDTIAQPIKVNGNIEVSGDVLTTANAPQGLKVGTASPTISMDGDDGFVTDELEVGTGFYVPYANITTINTTTIYINEQLFDPSTITSFSNRTDINMTYVTADNLSTVSEINFLGSDKDQNASIRVDDDFKFKFRGTASQVTLGLETQGTNSVFVKKKHDNTDFQIIPNGNRDLSIFRSGSEKNPNVTIWGDISGGSNKAIGFSVLGDAKGHIFGDVPHIIGLSIDMPLMVDSNISTPFIKMDSTNLTYNIDITNVQDKYLSNVYGVKSEQQLTHTGSPIIGSANAFYGKVYDQRQISTGIIDYVRVMELYAQRGSGRTSEVDSAYLVPFYLYLSDASWDNTSGTDSYYGTWTTGAISPNFNATTSQIDYRGAWYDNDLAVAGNDKHVSSIVSRTIHDTTMITGSIGGSDSPSINYTGIDLNPFLFGLGNRSVGFYYHPSAPLGQYPENIAILADTGDILLRDGNIHVTGDLNVTGNIEGFRYISVTTEVDSNAAGKERNPFNQSNYLSYISTTNAVNDITYDDGEGTFDVGSNGVYKVEVIPFINIANSDEVNLTIRKKGSLVYGHDVFVHSSVDPVIRPYSIILPVNTGDKITVHIGAWDGVDAITFMEGTTINIQQIS